MFISVSKWCERSAGFASSPQEMALVVSRTTNSHEVHSVYLAGIVCLTGKLVWPWPGYYLLK